MLRVEQKHIGSNIIKVLAIHLLLWVICIYNPAMAAEIEYMQTQNQAQIKIPLNNMDDYEIESKDNELLLSFSSPIAEKLSNISKNLSLFVKNQNISEDKRHISLSIDIPYSVRTQNDNGILQIEIVRLPPKNEDTATQTKPLIADYGEHEGFTRLSFAYNKKPRYSIKTSPNATTISFLNQVEIDNNKIKNGTIYPLIEQTSNRLGGTDIKISRKLLKSFEYNNKIILDVANEAPKNTQEQLQSQNSSKGTTTIYNMKDTSLSKAKDEVASLAFPWNMEVGVSVFQRGKYIWIAFDHPHTVDLDDLRRLSRKVADQIIQLPHTKATILRITPKENVKVGLRKEGLLWIIDLYTHNIEYKVKELPIFMQYNSMKEAYLYIPSNSNGNSLSIIDPEIGDMILIGTETELGLGIKEEYHYPDLEILPAKQGFALVPNASDIMLDKGSAGFSIKALNRSLNISDNLENLKRQQQFLQSGTEVFNLKIPAQILKLDFNTAENQLKEDIAQAAPEQQSQAKLLLIKYYLGLGLGTEAQQAIASLNTKDKQEIKPETISALTGIANFLMRRYDEALDNFSDANLENNNEAIFWRALTDAALGFKKENDAVLLTYIPIIKDYPQELKERIALIAVDTAIQAYDDISTQNFMDILKNAKGKDSRKAQILYLNAKKFAFQGYPNNALREYAAAAMHDSQKFASLSRYERINMELKLNLIKPQKAIPELERLRFAWGDPAFKRILLQRLAEVYEMNKDYNKAMKIYQESMSFAETPQQKEEIINKMIKLFEDIFINGRADDIQAVKAIALYKDYEWLAPRSRYYTPMAQKIADRMVAVDLLTSASELLKEQLRLVNLQPEQKAQLGIRLALIYLFEQDSMAALDILNKTNTSELSSNQKQYRKIITAKALSNIDKNEEALKLLENDYSKNALLLKTDIYWKAGQWDKAADNIKYLIEKPQKGKALSAEQMSYILDWITALKKSNHNTVIFRIRNTFLPYFENTPYYSTFNVLTTNLETNRVDMNSIDQVVEDISAYSNFSKLYDDSLLKNLPTQPEN